MGKRTKRLRRGFTTGTCAAAGAKAAAQALFGRETGRGGRKVEKRPPGVSVTLPSGEPFMVKVASIRRSGNTAEAVIVKDAGDDPDVTDRARIVTSVELLTTGARRSRTVVRGGEGVGTVTKPGLKIGPGRPAINPVPLRMIRKAVREAALDAGVEGASVVVTVSVPDGVELAKKTMNARLGIVGGISILGTTGIVEPLSLDAYRDSIVSAVDVAAASGSTEVVFSTGRSSEKAAEAAMKGLAREAFILTGDHMGFALETASSREELRSVTVAGQFGKFTKLAAGHFETHCTDAEVELGFLARLALRNGAPPELAGRIEGANTAREVFFMLKDAGLREAVREVAALVQRNSRKLCRPGVKVRSMLVGYDGHIECISP